MAREKGMDVRNAQLHPSEAPSSLLPQGFSTGQFLYLIVHHSLCLDLTL